MVLVVVVVVVVVVVAGAVLVPVLERCQQLCIAKLIQVTEQRGGTMTYLMTD